MFILTVVADEKHVNVIVNFNSLNTSLCISVPFCQQRRKSGEKRDISLVPMRKSYFSCCSKWGPVIVLNGVFGCGGRNVTISISIKHYTFTFAIVFPSDAVAIVLVITLALEVREWMFLLWLLSKPD